jgi:hypothetical protein
MRMYDARDAAVRCGRLKAVGVLEIAVVMKRTIANF